MLKSFKEAYYHEGSNQDFFGKELYNKLISLEGNYTKQKLSCFSKWIELDLKKIKTRLPSKIYDSEFGKYDSELDRMINEKNISDKDEVGFYILAINFFSSISCPACKSELVEPIDSNFSSEIKITMHCTTCNEKFTLEDVIENYLEGYYAYEIMKAGAKGGVFALGRCPNCKLGTYLNFDKICMYCGNMNRELEDPDFEHELEIRNVNLHADKW